MPYKRIEDRRQYEKMRRKRDAESIAEYMRDYRSKNGEKLYEAVKEWRKNNPERARELSKQRYQRSKDYYREYNARRKVQFPDYKSAVQAVNNAVKAGYLIKPSTCNDCNNPGRVEGHHHLGYSKENHLKVQWLCKKCHEKKHSI